MKDDWKLFLGQNFMVFKTMRYYGVTAGLELRVVEMGIRKLKDGFMGPKVLQQLDNPIERKRQYGFVSVMGAYTYVKPRPSSTSYISRSISLLR